MLSSDVVMVHGFWLIVCLLLTWFWNRYAERQVETVVEKCSEMIEAVERRAVQSITDAYDAQIDDVVRGRKEAKMR